MNEFIIEVETIKIKESDIKLGTEIYYYDLRNNNELNVIEIMQNHKSMKHYANRKHKSYKLTETKEIEFTGGKMKTKNFINELNNTSKYLISIIA